MSCNLNYQSYINYCREPALVFLSKNCSPTDPSNINTLLETGKASLATSLWPLTVRPDGRGRVKLNKYQRKAIDLAYSNNFVMIQGPPGIGLSTAQHTQDCIYRLIHTSYHSMQALEKVLLELIWHTL